MHFINHPLINLFDFTDRFRAYCLVLLITALSVPFFHLDPSSRLPLSDLIIHIVEITAKTAITLFLAEKLLRFVGKSVGTDFYIRVWQFWLLSAVVYLALSPLAGFFLGQFSSLTGVKILTNQNDLHCLAWRCFLTMTVIVLITALILVNRTVFAENRRLKNNRESDTSNKRREFSIANSEPAIAVNVGQRDVEIPCKGIIAIKAEGNYCILWVHKLGTTQKYMIRHTLQGLFIQLHQPQFYQCHRSYIVNINFIQAVCKQGRQSAAKINGLEDIPISRDRRQKLLELVSEMEVTE